MVAACALVSKAQQDTLCQGDALREQLCPVGGGYSKIYAPDGQSIGTALAHTEEGLITADIDLAMIAAAKTVADPAGHYSRPDVTRLMFNNKSQRPVVSFDEARGVIAGLSNEIPDESEVPDGADS